MQEAGGRGQRAEGRGHKGIFSLTTANKIQYFIPRSEDNKSLFVFDQAIARGGKDTIYFQAIA